VRSCDSGLGVKGFLCWNRRNVSGLPEFGRVSSGFALGEPVQVSSCVNSYEKKNCFSSPLDCVEGNGRCRIAEVGRVRGWCSIRWISA